MLGQMGGSGLRSKPGVPQTGWRWEDIQDLGGRKAICEWCEKKRIRYVHKMSHPNWPDLVRVGSHCAVRMGDPFARKREREFRRNPDKWRTLMADGTLINGEREFLSTVRDLLQRSWIPSRQDVWLHVFWVLVVFAVLVFLNRR
jgi:hypothetical protein